MFITLHHPRGKELVGIIPDFLLESDPRSAAEQFNERYAHGGGWQPMKDWTMEKGVLTYPDDPSYEPVATINFRDETIRVYAHAWVSIEQPDGTFEVARMD